MRWNAQLEQARISRSRRETLTRRAALDDTARQVLAAAAVLGRRFDWRPLAAMVELEETGVVALNLPMDTVVGHVLHLPTRV